MYLSSSAFDDAVKKEYSKIKELEDKYNEKIVEHSVRIRLLSGIASETYGKNRNNAFVLFVIKNDCVILCHFC